MPMPIISVAQMREWEQATWAAGQTEIAVINNVGKAIAESALRLTRKGDFILILAGKGNNGEDARHARKHLQGRRVELFNVEDPRAELSGIEQALNNVPALVVDGLFGIGLNRPLGPDWIRLLECVNQSRRRVLAVDVPSGLNADTGETFGAGIEATVTLTVGAPKLGLLSPRAWRYTGRVEVAREVGLTPCPFGSPLQWTLTQDFFDYPPRRPVASHKGSHGHLAIIAGSPGFHGAAVLAARGGQRAQPGLITLYAPSEVYAVIAAQLQAVMVAPWVAGTPIPGKFSAFLAGPGLAAPDLPEELKLEVQLLWQHSPAPVIVDASALEWLPRQSKPIDALRVLTPHPGEAARLLSSTTEDVQADRAGALREISRAFGNAWVLLKGHQTLIGRAEGNLFVNGSGNPWLAQGGSGDVLSGYLAGLLAQPMFQADPLGATRFAAWEHGAAADRLQENRGGWTVEDLVNELGRLGSARP